MAVTALLDLQAKPDQADALVRLFKDILGDTRKYDGCLGIEAQRNLDDPNNIVLIERWETRGHHEKYMAWRTETGVMETLGAMLAGPPSIRYYEDTGA